MAKATKPAQSRPAQTAQAAKRRPSRKSGMIAVCIGLALLGLGIFMALSFMTADVGIDINASAESCWTGLLGAWMAFGGIFTLGKASALLLAVLVACWGVHIAANARFLTTWPQVFGGLLILAGFSLGVCALGERYDMNTGGLLAIYVSPPAVLYFGRWGLVLAATGIVILGILLAFGEAAIAFVHQTIFIIRDAVLGLGSLSSRLRHMFRLLFNPRLAVAGGGTVSGIAADEPATTEKDAPVQRSAAKETTPPTVMRSASHAELSNRETEVTNIRRSAPQAEKAESAITNTSALAEETQAAEMDGNSSVVIPPPESHPVFNEWKPRESFHSRFLNLDPSGDIPTTQPPIQSVDAAVASRPAKKPAADIIMDVDALTEESDRLEEDDSNGSSPTNKSTTAHNDSQENSAVVEDGVSSEAAVIQKPVTPFSPPVTAQPRPEPRQAAQQPTPRPEPVKPVASASASASKPKQAAPISRDSEVREKPLAGDELANYRLPTLELLDPPQPPVVEDSSIIEEKAHILEQTLAEFKIEGKVVHVERGPRVTMYEISLAPGIRLSKVTSLADNIAMQLQAESVRIIAPIPGKNTIGIEIPNSCKELVSLCEIVSAVNREKKRQALPVCLGKDVSGAALVADLARMPHLLIAGATGSGKSVCINSIILSVMMCCRPDEAQMILVDPKVVELSRFKDIPHLMSPVITDMKRAVSVLDWICQKMDERYEQMSQVSVNNIAKFNALGESGIRERLDEFASLEEIDAFPKKMPYMVVIIDELADLMMVAGKEVEHHITRLAAKSRAVGIHLILATQRPSVDVITGLIKANMPCRIAFQVASRVDSRTILDQNGAETLLGQGDMLYLPPGVGKLTRAQGVFVSDEELFRVVDFVKSEASPQYHEDLLGPVIGAAGGKVDVSAFDELFIQSGESIIENQRGSVSLLQRKFGIGYGRASRIIDQLASVGLLGPFRDGKARQILLTLEEFRAKFGLACDTGGGCDDDDEGTMAGLRDDERAPEQLDWGDEDEERYR